MYAKLVVGASRADAYKCIRDIGRLITSENPSLSLLSGFNTAASVIIDATPAGWEYVGSVHADDQAGIAGVEAVSPTYSNNAVAQNLVFKAPCLNGGLFKFCALSMNYRTQSSNYTFSLTGATDGTSTGVLTNEGPRIFMGSSATTSAVDNNLEKYLSVEAGVTIHLIANERHITIVQSNRGIMAVWESSNTDLHTYYNSAPFVQYFHPTTTRRLKLLYIAPHTGTSTIGSAFQNHMHTAFNLTDPATGTTYGTYDINDARDASATSTSSTASNRNTTNFLVNLLDRFQNTINSSGQLRYLVTPIFYSIDQFGYPTQFVSGVSPVYLAKNGIGNSGDTIEVNGDEYYYFDCGNFGLLARSS
jgi:hypothetical protein